MNDTKHETKPTSTGCPVCREWERDMNGTVATLQREREINKELFEALLIAKDHMEHIAAVAGYNSAEKIGPFAPVMIPVYSALAKAKGAGRMTALFAIEMNIGGAWERFPEDGIYNTREEADQAVKDHIIDCINAVEGGDMDDSPDPSDFRVVEVVE